jgi:hypothetical protein
MSIMRIRRALLPADEEHTSDRPSRPIRSFVVVAGMVAALLTLALIAKVPGAESQTTTAIANHAYSGFHDAQIDMPNSQATIATLSVPLAGKYVINAKLQAHNISSSASSSDLCTLNAGADFDTLGFDVDGAAIDDQEAVALQVVHTFTSPGAVTLRCTDNGSGTVKARFTKITAVQVDALSNLGI